MDGGAKPRLTSGGEAGVDGVKFQDRLLDLQDGISHQAAKPRRATTAAKPELIESSFRIGP
jgi:hypothetical protein